MSEPKKETVRIVLPPRRDGQPLASNPRETAMINLPPKPIQKPGAPGSVSVPSSTEEPSTFPPLPKPPFAPKAPPVEGLSAPPAAPKPPSIAGLAPPAPKQPFVASVAPKPPSVVGVPPGVPKSVSFAGPPPLAPKPPGTAMPSASIGPSAPKASSVTGVPGIAPASPSAESKKETAKVPPSASGTRPNLPQASVHLQRRPGVSASTSSSSAITVAPQVQTEGRVGLVMGVLALAASLIAVGIQAWMFL